MERREAKARARASPTARVAASASSATREGGVGGDEAREGEREPALSASSRAPRSLAPSPTSVVGRFELFVSATRSRRARVAAA